MTQEGASSERVTSEEPIASRTAAVPSTASRYGAAPPTETAGYIARAHAKIQQGDIAAARRLLERASGSDDGEAWFVLAETYDPQRLASWGVIGIKPDLEKAKTFYQEAQRRGAQGAPKRLLALRN
jgi:TPR repeat protein